MRHWDSTQSFAADLSSITLWDFQSWDKDWKLTSRRLPLFASSSAFSLKEKERKRMWIWFLMVLCRKRSCSRVQRLHFVKWSSTNCRCMLCLLDSSFPHLSQRGSRPPPPASLRLHRQRALITLVLRGLPGSIQSLFNPIQSQLLTNEKDKKTGRERKKD